MSHATSNAASSDVVPLPERHSACGEPPATPAAAGMSGNPMGWNSSLQGQPLSRCNSDDIRLDEMPLTDMLDLIDPTGLGAGSSRSRNNEGSLDSPALATDPPSFTSRKGSTLAPAAANIPVSFPMPNNRELLNGLPMPTSLSAPPGPMGMQPGMQQHGGGMQPSHHQQAAGQQPPACGMPGPLPHLGQGGPGPYGGGAFPSNTVPHMGQPHQMQQNMCQPGVGTQPLNPNGLPLGGPMGAGGAMHGSLNQPMGQQQCVGTPGMPQSMGQMGMPFNGAMGQMPMGQMFTPDVSRSRRHLRHLRLLARPPPPRALIR